jgi:hypothetical protein
MEHDLLTVCCPNARERRIAGASRPGIGAKTYMPILPPSHRVRSEGPGTSGSNFTFETRLSAPQLKLKCHVNSIHQQKAYGSERLVRNR